MGTSNSTKPAHPQTIMDELAKRPLWGVFLFTTAVAIVLVAAVLGLEKFVRVL